MNCRGLAAWGIGAALSVVVGGVGGGQTSAPSAVVRTAGGASADGSGPAVLSRRVSLRLEQVTLREALEAIARDAGVRIAYSRNDVPVDQRVTLLVDSMTVADALSALLRGTGIGVSVSADGQVMLAPGLVPVAIAARQATRPPTTGGAIAGSVTDSATKATVPRVEVVVVETRQTAISDAQGQYAIASVPAGSYHVLARRVGFIAQTRVVVVRDGATATLNFLLNQPAYKLDEVVTTGAGEERRYQVGNDISTLSVDSIAPTAAVTSVTDVLTARVPGLQVIETGGLTGSGEAIRIEGQSSISLQSDPIIIVDGVRQNNTPGGSYTPTFGGAVASPSRLNDIDFSQVETIDVLKGPAATTEYGTDAANGVIVITTKHGTSGKPQWHLSAEDGFSQIPTNAYPNFYYSFGRLPSNGEAVQCPLMSATGVSSTAGTCVVDSVTHFNPLNDPYTSPFGTGSRSKYDLDVSGGTDVMRYFVAGGLSNETGAARLPPAFLPEAQAYGLPGAVLSPNGEQQRSGRANLFLKLGSTADVSVNTAYMSTYHTTGASVGFMPRGKLGGQLPDSANYYGYGSLSASPLWTFGQPETQQTSRFTGSLTGNWRPAPWFAAYADAGLDHASQGTTGTFYPQVGVLEGESPASGIYSLSQGVTDIYSADVRAAATVSFTRALRSVTTVGANMRDTRQSSVAAGASDLSVSDLNLVGASNISATQTGNRSSTLGGYVEEQLQVAERLFLIGAVRIDGSSGFGYEYQTATYPKVSASWLAVPNGPATVRLRSAFGASGVAPYNGLSLQLLTPTPVATSGGGSTGLQITQPGNADLKPERTAEWEGGVDVGLLGKRISLALTGYQKTTQDALYLSTLGWDLGSYPYEINIGEIRNTGAEGQISAIAIESRDVTWAVTLNASVNHNLLVHLAPGLSPLNVGVGNAQRQAPGYPLYGFWGYQTHYTTPANGILEPSDVTQDTSLSYMGSSIPTQNASFDTHLTVLRGTLTLGALFNYQGGYKVFNNAAEYAAQYQTSEAQNVPGAPLWQQARALAWTAFGENNSSGFFEDGTILRVQELSLTYALPARWARAAHVHNLSLTGAIRNLAYWTRYTGGDPAASNVGFDTPTTPGSFAVNNDLRISGANAVPLARYFQFRLNAGF